MCSRRLIPALVLSLALLVLSCGEEPAAPSTADRTGQVQVSLLDDPTEFKTLARSFALALRDPTLRERLKTDLARSTARENKLFLNRYVAQTGSTLLTAAASQDALVSLQDLREILSTHEVELYMPVPEHRLHWKGDENLIVVWHLDEAFRPIAYDLDGTPVEVTLGAPPDQPALVLTRRESVFPAKSFVDDCEIHYRLRL